MDDNTQLDERLRQLHRVEPPNTLRRTLLAIPNRLGARRSTIAQFFDNRVYLAIPVAIAAIAVFSFILTDQSTDIENQDAVAQQAIRDFVTTMDYLQSATVVANSHMQDRLGTELISAFNLPARFLADAEISESNGG